MAKMRWELEDLAFKHLEPEDYKTLAKQGGAEARASASSSSSSSRSRSSARSRAPGISRRRGHRAAQAPVVDLQEDDAAARSRTRRSTICSPSACSSNTVPECYHALGIIHDGWTPLQERIKDYIAQPKSNGYQSLHTTVFGPGRQLYEVQIRTREMHHTADFGIAAHWLYKEDAKSADELDRHLTWFRQILELQLDAKTPDEFLEFLKLDLYQDEIFVFTPTGDVIQLPKGATPIDFAFAVHTEVGLHCAGRPRERAHRPALAPAAQLRDRRDHHVANARAPPRLAGPRPNTGRARHKIRQWLKHEEPNTSATKLGAGDPRPRGQAPPPVAAPTASSSRAPPRRSSSTMRRTSWRRSGRATFTSPQALKPIYPEVEGQREATKPSAHRAAGGPHARRAKGVRIQGVDGIMVRYAQCCQPVPGDPVVGYVTRGRGVSIHRGDCPNLLLLAHEPERRLEIDWQEAEGERFVVRLALEGADRRGLYADLATARVLDAAPTSAAWSCARPTASVIGVGTGGGGEPRPPAEDHQGHAAREGRQRSRPARANSGGRLNAPRSVDRTP